jgi:hypothetical protein
MQIDKKSLRESACICIVCVLFRKRLNGNPILQGILRVPF